MTVLVTIIWLTLVFSGAMGVTYMVRDLLDSGKKPLALVAGLLYTALATLLTLIGGVS